MILFITFTDPNSISEKKPKGVQKQFPIRVSYYALKMLKEKLGRGLTLTDDGTDYEAYETLLFYSLKKGHDKTYPGKDFPFKEEQMEDIMDEVYTEFMQIIPKFFSDKEIEAAQQQLQAQAGGGEVAEKKQ